MNKFFQTVNIFQIQSKVEIINESIDIKTNSAKMAANKQKRNPISLEKN